MRHRPEHVAVVVAPRSFDRSSNITGPIVLRHSAPGDRAQHFPAPGWVDFPVVILGWWRTELRALEIGASFQATCLFMDGPFEFRVAAAQATLWRVECVRRGVDDDVSAAEFLVPSAALNEAVRSAANASLAECVRRGWADDQDVQTLRRSLESI